MRNLAAALCFAFIVPLPAGTTACSHLEQQAPALKPRDARSAYAEAEILFVGVINTADILAAKGVLTGKQVGDLLPAFASIADSLDGAYKLLQAGEAIAALAKIDLAHADLARLADALSRANEAATVFRPSPTIWHPVTI